MSESSYSRGRHLHTLAVRLGMGDEDYRAALAGYGVTTSKDLTPRQAGEFAAAMQGAIDRIEERRRATSATPTASDVIDKIEQQAQREPEPEHQVTFPTAEMLKRLKFHAIPCAIHYIGLGELGAWRDSDGMILSGEELRGWLKRRWNGVRRDDDPYREFAAPIPAALLRRLYSCWINQRSNSFLLEGAFKASVKSPTKCYYESLSHAAVMYLIDRYRAMHDTLERQDETVLAAKLYPSHTHTENR